MTVSWSVLEHVYIFVDDISVFGGNVLDDIGRHFPSLAAMGSIKVLIQKTTKYLTSD